MKRCPTCNKTSDQNLSFCIDDGSPLQRIDEPEDAAPDEETIVSPSARSQGTRESRQAEPAYQPPAGYVPPGTPPGQYGRRKVWPWVIAVLALVLLVLAGLGIAAVTFIPAMLRGSNENTSNLNTNVNRNDSNANLSSNSSGEDQDANDNSDWEERAPSTSESDVLSILTDLENEWTVANINADKKKLNRILADDYVGTSDGKAQGKADYLRTIQRNTSIQKWAFEDLQVSLRGDRASLTGVLRLEVQNEQGEIAPVAFRFTDKFVWRDNRWQAVSSEVQEVK